MTSAESRSRRRVRQLAQRGVAVAAAAFGLFFVAAVSWRIVIDGVAGV
ncbi:hypothetical protein [Jannaschia sp. R86511]